MVLDPNSRVYQSDGLESSWANDPLNYTIKAFAAFLQTIFEIAPRGSFHWTPNSEDTEVVITEENPVHVESVERKPVISLVLGPTAFSGTSLDDLQFVRTTDAAETHTDLLSGNITLNCMSRVAQECRFLGWLCARTIWDLRKIFIQETCIHEVGRKIQVGAVSPAGALVQGDTEAEWHAVSVVVPLFLQWTDVVKPITNWDGRPINIVNHITSQIKLRMYKDEPSQPMAVGGVANPPPIRASVLRAARINGKVIQTAPPAPVEKVVQKSKV
jgi:hypothetical protein